MKNILVFISGLNGVSYHRLFLPYRKMALLDKSLNIQFLPKSGTNEYIINTALQYDIFVFSRMIDKDILKALKGRVKIICDCDDYWILDKKHLLYDTYKVKGYTESIKECLKMSDYVTTTTDILAKKIYKSRLNKNVFVFENGLEKFGQYNHFNNPSKRIRFGFICSSSHIADMELIEGITKYFDREELNRLQFVLCGFDKAIVYNHHSDGTVTTEDATTTDENPWVRWEKNLTDDYSIIDSVHKDFLKQYNLDINYEIDDCYRRITTQPIDGYAYLYDEIDVLIAPLKNTEFNRYKSELKMIEAGIKKKGLIISNVVPYSALIQDGVNCLSVDNKEGVRGFVNAVKRYLNNPELINKTAENLSLLVEDRFNLRKISERRIEWIKSL